MNASTSGGKLPLHGPRRVIFPPKTVGEFVSNVNRYPVTAVQRRFYYLLCRMGTSRFSGHLAFKLDKLHCSYRSLSESLQPYGHVDNFLIACYCLKFFEESHPSRSKKHYFFPYIGESMMNYRTDPEALLVKKAFEGACSARKMHLSNLLYFPICFQHHWFLFIVDVTDRLFVFLDIFYTKDDDYQLHVSAILIEGFKTMWHRFINYATLPFDDFQVVYPATPRQENRDDCGVYVLKFLGLWNSPRVCLPSLLSREDIPNVRIQLMNEIYFSPLNQADKTILYNIYADICAAAKAGRGPSKTSRITTK
ncbi:hypothetical protein ACP70R_015756 [Stipagrostis hirtigluma subsp. patula]